MDSIPWESLDTLGRSKDHRSWYLIAAGIVVVAIGVSAVRNLGASPPDPAPATTTTTTAVLAEEGGAPTSPSQSLGSSPRQT